MTMSLDKTEFLKKIAFFHGENFWTLNAILFFLHY